jgi:hypothetical protein
VKQHKLFLGLFLLTLFATAQMGCSVEDVAESSGAYSDAQMTEQVNKYNDLVERHNTLLNNGYETTQLMAETAEIMEELDQKARNCREMQKEIKSTISASSVSKTKSDLRVFKAKIDDALVTLGKVEKQFSTKNKNQMVSNANTLIKDAHISRAKSRYKLSAEMLQTLSGLRDLFLGMYNDLVDHGNLRLQALESDPIVTTETNRAEPTRRASTPAPEPAPRPRPVEVNPIVSSSTSGGLVRGIVRDSQTGAAISGAFVGFKKLRESTDYFHTTRTNSEGAYESPYLRPGAYYVDIRHDGYVISSNENVSISIGRETQENVSITQPISDDEIRITVSWTREKSGAVKDVDSYLNIPGVSRPLDYTLKGRWYHDAHLDRDDTEWMGPETITIRNIKQGIYTYYVRNFNVREDIEALGNSDIRVKVYQGSRMIRDYRVPEGRGLSYELFKIIDGAIVDSRGFTNN